MCPASLCRCVPLTSTSARSHKTKSHVLPGQAHSRHISGSDGGRPGRRHRPLAGQIRTGVRYFSPRPLLYFAAVQGPETAGSGFRITLLTWCGAMGIRTPDLLHAISRQHVHSSTSVQVTVPERPHQSAGIQAGCRTFVLYRPEPPLSGAERAQLVVRETHAGHNTRLYRPATKDRRDEGT